MNTKDVIRHEKKDGFSLLYSHDGDFTRHRIDFYSDGTFACLINEQMCFRRGTHDAMAKVLCIDLLSMNPAPYRANH